MKEKCGESLLQLKKHEYLKIILIYRCRSITNEN